MSHSPLAQTLSHSRVLFKLPGVFQELSRIAHIHNTSTCPLIWDLQDEAVYNLDAEAQPLWVSAAEKVVANARKYFIPAVSRRFRTSQERAQVVLLRREFYHYGFLELSGLLDVLMEKAETCNLECSLESAWLAQGWRLNPSTSLWS